MGSEIIMFSLITHSMERIVFIINYTKLMSRQSLFSNLKVRHNMIKQFLVSFVFLLTPCQFGSD